MEAGTIVMLIVILALLCLACVLIYQSLQMEKRHNAANAGAEASASGNVNKKQNGQ